MQFFIISSLVAVAAAASSACPSSGLYINPQCCTQSSGFAATNCVNPSGSSTTAQELIAECAKSEKKASCCALAIAGQNIFCKDAK
ncbi:hypothetical protein VHEMI09159 [[Torrubiella] hemipterigena]|uniref:Hydrophobin n=1 Tax=[Torrubiella] hemipterigena TaxID=1531966 RepID=A0A0A1T8Y9_9HYPO|nr:hypothetical protein VHEMI09159 [[Torrubiella] hemipterigena]